MTQPNAPTTHTVQTSRLALHCRIHGDPDGLPMLLIHDSFASSRWWEPLFALLPEAIHAVAPDLRGCGQSAKPESGYTIEEQAADLSALVAALGWRNFDLVGHGSGGAIAVEFALTQPSLLNTLTLVAPAPIEGIFTPLDGIMALAEMQQNEPLLRQALTLLLPTYDQQVPAQQAFFDQLVTDAQAMAPAAFTAVAESLNQWNRFGAAQQLTLPTLLIWGDQDQIVHRDAMTRTLLAIPGANNLDVLRNVGHSPMIEAPLALAERLLEFITEDYAGFDEARTMAAASHE
jgi:branched-chain amino acid transport system permease protein